MPIPMPAPAPVPPVPTGETVAAVMASQQDHCAPSTWSRFVASLRANGFPYL